jgi:hypothetical protein
MRPKSVDLSTISSSRLDLLRIPAFLPTVLKKEFYRGNALDGLALDRSAVHVNTKGLCLLNSCKGCHRSLMENEKLPALAIANSMILGQVPQELRDLTVVEEALIARRRAKMWVVHLRGDSQTSDSDELGVPGVTSSGMEQKGLRGHVVVYNVEPKNLAASLPPSLDDASVPICIVFVGNKEPTKEWLMQKAKPLIICTEKVRAALVWLKANNPLYRDIVVNHNCLDD